MESIAMILKVLRSLAPRPTDKVSLNMTMDGEQRHTLLRAMQ
ncbi:hypothetical protein JMJ77_0015232, partial [Colletotrichum scovillei]